MFDIHHGDCRHVLDVLPSNSIEACVTDPPYHFQSIQKRFAKVGRTDKTWTRSGPHQRVARGFMGKVWDGGDIAFDPELWVAVERVLKPGAHLLAFGGTRTFHRMACAIEDAGFEIRDTIMWVYGSGFPKSHNQDGEWAGWGTALKPAWEPIIVARKPIDGTVSGNLNTWGVGAINIDGCRIDTAEDLNGGAYAGHERRRDEYTSTDTGSGAVPLSRLNRGIGEFSQPQGRWPANLIHDGSDEVLAAFPTAPGQIADASSSSDSRKTQNTYGEMKRGSGGGAARSDNGSAARFFYCAKASRADRNDGMAEKIRIEIGGVTGWGNEVRKVRLLVDTARSRPKVIDVSGAPRNDVTEWNTTLFGNENEGPSLPVLTFTTETGTSLTTESIISSFLRKSHTNANTRGANGEMGFGGSLAESAAGGIEFQATIDAATVSALGVGHAASKTPWKINVSAAVSDHPTVKPTDLMRYLCRLVTPPGGTVLDPFAGSGSTGRGAVAEGFNFIGIEQDAGYAEIARARVSVMADRVNGPDVFE